MSPLTIAAIQMVSTDSLDANLEQAEALTANAVRQGAKLVVLPETFAMMKTSRQLSLGEQERQTGRLQRFLGQLARRHAIWLVGGTIPVAPSAAADRVYAACPVFDARGECRGIYNKIHLFDVDVADRQGSYRESATFLPGSVPLVVETPFGRLGLAVCYDLRFPELFRLLFAAGAEIIAIPAAFTLATGESHWLPLLRARAIENQCHVIGANQGGAHNPRRHTSGGSAIIDGWGRVLAEAPRGPAALTATVDLAAVAELRARMPVASHQRFHVTGPDAVDSAG